MIGWPCCFGPMARQQIVMEVCVTTKLTLWSGSKREEGGLWFHNLLQGHIVIDLKISH
jgi:hypothetical protein